MSGTSVRRPRFRLLANGTALIGAEYIEVDSNGYFQSDRFHAQIALGLDKAFDANWWSQQSDIRLEVQMGMLSPGAPEGDAGWQTMILGNVDSFQIDLVNRRVTADGRDLSSLLIDAKTQEAFANQTASQIATTLAARHGLAASVKPTTMLVGQYYELEHDALTLDNFHRQTTEWDLLTYLADQEGYDVWVTGTTLYFQPTPGPNTPPYAITYSPGSPPSLNVLSLAMERSLTLAKDIRVTVKTWNSAQNNAYVINVDGSTSRAHTKSVTGTAGSGNGRGIPAQQYVFIKPGMTPDQALKFAQQKLADLTRHERKLHIEMPGELTLTPRSMIALSGTGTTFDQSYFVAEVNRRMSFTDGFTQEVLAKNTSPRTEETVV